MWKIKLKKNTYFLLDLTFEFIIMTERFARSENQYSFRLRVVRKQIISRARRRILIGCVIPTVVAVSNIRQYSVVDVCDNVKQITERMYLPKKTLKTYMSLFFLNCEIEDMLSEYSSDLVVSRFSNCKKKITVNNR